MIVVGVPLQLQPQTQDVIQMEQKNMLVVKIAATGILIPVIAEILLRVNVPIRKPGVIVPR